MVFLEILLSIHGLLLLSSWFIGRSWLEDQPSLKLKLARILLVSCVFSPLIVHCVLPVLQTERLHIIAFETVQEYVSQPIVKNETFYNGAESMRVFSLGGLKYYQLFYFLFCFFLAFRTYRLWAGLAYLRLILAEAIPYRRAGKLSIKVSHRCDIPFSVCLWNKAFIILPISLFSSAKNVQIAIAHEGQHHRNADCLWAYFMEALRIIFWGNLGVTRWYRILSDLQEFSCDEVLVGQPKISAHDYGRCLFAVVQAVSQCSLPANREIACTVPMALSKDNEEGTFIIRRISMLSTYSKRTAKSLVFKAVVACISIGIPVCVAYATTGSLTGSIAKEVDTSHINPKMQSIAENEINKAVKQYHAQSGVIAIADPATGNILAFAEVNQNKNQRSWRSRVFSPGSTIKPFIAAAAIESGSSSETKSYDCRSPYSINGTSFTNVSSVQSASLGEAMTQSINVCFIKVSQEAGAAVVRNKLKDFGFDMNTWWQANQGEQLQLAKAALGENIPVTIASLIQSYAILANNGRSLGGGETAVITTATSKTINHMLEHAVLKGTGEAAHIPGIAVAGKTGTVVENKKNHLALFAGYMPVNSPRYVLLVVIEGGAVQHKTEILTSGGALAAPVFRQVVVNILQNTHQ